MPFSIYSSPVIAHILHAPLFTPVKSKGVVSEQLSPTTYVLTFSKGKIAIEAGPGQLQVGDKIIASRKEGVLVIQKTEIPEQKHIPLSKSGELLSISASVPAGNKIVVPEQIKESFFFFSSPVKAEEWLMQHGVTPENARVAVQQVNAREVVIQTVSEKNGNTSIIIESPEHAQTNLENLRLTMLKSPVWKSLGPEIFINALISKGTLDVDRLYAIDSALVRTAQQRAQPQLFVMPTPATPSQLPQWLNSALNNPVIPAQYIALMPFSHSNDIIGFLSELTGNGSPSSAGPTSNSTLNQFFSLAADTVLSGLNGPVVQQKADILGLSADRSLAQGNLDAANPFNNAKSLIAYIQTIFDSIPLETAGAQGPLPEPVSLQSALTQITTANTVFAALEKTINRLSESVPQTDVQSTSRQPETYTSLPQTSAALVFATPVVPHNNVVQQLQSTLSLFRDLLNVIPETIQTISALYDHADATSTPWKNAPLGTPDFFNALQSTLTHARQLNLSIGRYIQTIQPAAHPSVHSLPADQTTISGANAYGNSAQQAKEISAFSALFAHDAGLTFVKIKDFLQRLSDLPANTNNASLAQVKRLTNSIHSIEQLLQNSFTPELRQDFSMPLSSSNSTMRLHLENTLSKLDSFSLMAKPEATNNGDARIIALPVKIGQSWTEMRLRFVNNHGPGPARTDTRHYSVTLQVAPSSCGAITADLDYYTGARLSVRMSFEDPQIYEWFSKYKDSMCAALTQCGLPAVTMECGLVQQSGPMLPNPDNILSSPNLDTAFLDMRA